jgi:ABC-type sugar transport system ATPase subunit
MTANSRIAIELAGIDKRYGGVHALRSVDIAIAEGSIHALVGENGAGKSTLGRVIAGAVRPDAGHMFVRARKVSYRSPRDALSDGLTMIAQEPVLVPQRSVLDNVFLGQEPHHAGVLASRRQRRKFADLSKRAGLQLRPQTKVRELAVADRQKVAILQALARDAQLIVMDEPTASLTPDEIQRLFEIVRALSTSGTTIVYVTHFLKEVLDLAEAVTVLKDGQVVRTSRTADETPEALVTAMLGRTLDLTFPPKTPPKEGAPVVLRVTGLRRESVLNGVSLEVRAGEIVGLAGLIGSGRSEVAHAIFGALRVDRGDVYVREKKVRRRSPAAAIRAGIALLPEDRKLQGLLMRRSVVQNVTLPHLREVSHLGVLTGRRERATVQELTTRLDVRMARLSALMDSLSGGNQQKVLFAKWLYERPLVLLADEPTRGVDVGAKRAIYQIITDLASEGVAVLLISSELEEVLGLAHRVLVMRAGRISAEFSSVAISGDEVMHAAFGTDALNVAVGAR